MMYFDSPGSEGLNAALELTLVLVVIIGIAAESLVDNALEIVEGLVVEQRHWS